MEGKKKLRDRIAALQAQRTGIKIDSASGELSDTISKIVTMKSLPRHQLKSLKKELKNHDLAQLRRDAGQFCNAQQLARLDMVMGHRPKVAEAAEPARFVDNTGVERCRLRAM